MKARKRASSNLPAAESPRVQKLRKKIQKHIESDKSKATPDALQDMGKRISRWLDRQGESRLTLQDRKITYFGNNEHLAPVQSEAVKMLMKQLGGSSVNESLPLKNRVEKQKED